MSGETSLTPRISTGGRGKGGGGRGRRKGRGEGEESGESGIERGVRRIRYM